MPPACSCHITWRRASFAGSSDGSADLSAALPARPRPLPRCCCSALTLLSATAQAQTQPADNQTPAAEREEYLRPVDVPNDAIIVPYDVKSETGVQDADRLMVPYDRYVELWNRANPDKKIEAHPAPLPYALSGATYRGRWKAKKR